MKKIKNTIILILVFCCFIGAYSQTKPTIRGKVIDQKDKSSIPGATVVETDKDNRVVSGATTDIDGNFVYQMKNQANTMKVTVIGYQAKVFKPNLTKSVVIELVSSDIELTQVNISGRAKSSNKLTNIDDRDNATSTVKIDLMEMRDEGITSAADALQGKVTGLDIISNSGDPGSGSQIVIRGLSSMGNNKPLIVIDGIQQDRVPSNVDLASSDAEDISNMINIALQDIKSIEVLKDAASTAVYGAKGADGVLLIETNRGRLGKVQFDYQYKSTFNFQPKPIPMLNGNEYVTLQLEEWHNKFGIYTVPSEIAYDRDYIDFYNYSANTDWLAAVTQNSVTHDHFFKISGGGEKTRYYTSFSYVNEGGTTINTSNRRFSTRVNLDYFLSKKLKFSVQFNYSNNKNEDNIFFNKDNKIRQMAYKKAPNMSIMKYDSKGNPTGEYFTPINSYQGNGVDYYNPVAVARLGKNDYTEDALENTFRLEYDILDWLVFRETVSFSYSGTKSSNFVPYNAIGVDWLDWQVNKSEEDNKMFTAFKTETQLAFNIPFKNTDHVLSGAATWATDQNQTEAMNTQSNKNPSVDIQDAAIGGQINYIGSWSSAERSVGGLINMNYKFKDRYMATINAREDAYSSFGINYRWSLFKSAAVAWRFSDEPFLKALKDNGVLSDCKLKASWGVSGRKPEDVYARFASYVTAGSGSYITNPAIIPDKIQLDNLRPAIITSTDAGLELNLFHDRFYLASDIYNKFTTDILFKDYNIPSSAGFNQLKYLNGGEMKNFGWELMLAYSVVKTKDWLVKIDFNTSQNTNTFTKLPDNFNTEKDISIGNGQYPKRIIAGEPIGSFFGFRYLGVYASDADAIARDADNKILVDGENHPIPMTYKGTYPFKGGDAIYEDINHDGKIDLNDVVYIGNSSPSYTGGFGPAFRYKNWDLSFQFYYRVGFDIINSTALNTEGMNDKNNQSKAVLSRWRVQGQSEPGLLPRAYKDNPANNLGSDRYVEKGDFMRLNSMKIGYFLSQSLCRKLNLQQASFALSARKLFTITNYSGQDPEVGQDASDPFWVGADNANTPPPKMVTLSFSVGF